MRPGLYRPDEAGGLGGWPPAMKTDMEKKGGVRSAYYQTIAREFLRQRGAPFFLSPRDLTLIAEWEASRIPLAAVLEGISAAFDRRRGGRGRGSALPLSFCAAAVEKAHSQHRDRRTGARRSADSRAAKRERAKGEAERFLASLADADNDLRAIYERGVGVLGSARPDEDVLEALDEGTDEVLWSRLPSGEKERWRRRARREFGAEGNSEIEGIARSLGVRASRAARKIPYLSLFYH